MNTKDTSMPPDVAEAHGRLSKELFYLYTKWRYWKRLYCADDETIKLLNYAAEFFFATCFEVFRDDMILTVARLTDSAESKVRCTKRENLTLPLLVSLIPQSGTLHEEATSALKTVQKDVKKFRKHRNRRIGHSDRATALNRRANKLPGLSLEAMDTLLADMATLLNLVERHYDQNEQHYEEGIYASSSADELVDFIRRDQDLEKYFQEKEFGDTDFDPSDID